MKSFVVLPICGEEVDAAAEAGGALFESCCAGCLQGFQRFQQGTALDCVFPSKVDGDVDGVEGDRCQLLGLLFVAASAKAIKVVMCMTSALTIAYVSKDGGPAGLGSRLCSDKLRGQREACREKT